MRLLGALLALVTLAGCAFAPPTDLAFGEQSKIGLVLLVAPDTWSGTGTGFRRVDLDSKRFDRAWFDLATGSIGPSNKVVGNFKLMVSITHAEPGYYTLKEFRLAMSNGFSNGMRYYCTNNASPVYNVQAGRVNVIYVVAPWKDEVRFKGATDEEVRTIVQLALSKYPSVVGDPIFEQPMKIISWQKKAICDVPENFEVR